jgi:hypothetical protein
LFDLPSADALPSAERARFARGREKQTQKNPAQLALDGGRRSGNVKKIDIIAAPFAPIRIDQPVVAEDPATENFRITADWTYRQDKADECMTADADRIREIIINHTHSP